MLKDRTIRLTKSEKTIILICFAIYFFWSCFFSGSFYNLYGPDELPRYEVVQYIARTTSLPTGWEPELIIDKWGFSYGLDIKLPYIISAVFVSIASTISNSDILQIIAARFTSVLSGTGIVVFSVLIGKRIFDNKPIRWVFIFLMSLLPQVVFLSSYFNLDIFSLLTVMIIVDSWIYAYESGWSKKSCVELGIGMGLCLVSYSFSYGYLVGSLLLYIYWNITHKDETSFKQFITKGIIMLLIVVVLSGWMLIRNYLVHDGDLFASNARYVQAEIYADPEYLPTNSYRGKGLSIIYMLLHSNFIQLLYRSTICVLGYMSVRGSIIMYVFYTLLLLLGLFYYFRSSERNLAKSILPFGIVSSSISLILCVYYSWAIDYQPQGRYIITILPILFIIVTVGLDKMLAKLSVKHQKIVIVAVCLLIVLFSVEAFIRCADYYNCLL